MQIKRSDSLSLAQGVLYRFIELGQTLSSSDSVVTYRVFNRGYLLSSKTSELGVHRTVYLQADEEGKISITFNEGLGLFGNKTTIPDVEYVLLANEIESGAQAIFRFFDIQEGELFVVPAKRLYPACLLTRSGGISKVQDIKVEKE